MALSITALPPPRDRDKVRAAILEGLGWTLLRIWSTEWWIDKERAVDKLHAQIEERLVAEAHRHTTRLHENRCGLDRFDHGERHL
jgi:hypothetical protein